MKLRGQVARAVVLTGSMVGTFLVMRAYLHNYPNADLDVLGHNIHHLFTGIVVVVAACVPLAIAELREKARLVLTLILGVGLSLVLDEWVYLITTDGSNQAYLTPVSLWGGVVAIVVASVYVTVVVIAFRD